MVSAMTFLPFWARFRLSYPRPSPFLRASFVGRVVSLPSALIPTSRKEASEGKYSRTCRPPPAARLREKSPCPKLEAVRSAVARSSIFSFPRRTTLVETRELLLFLKECLFAAGGFLSVLASRRSWTRGSKEFDELAEKQGPFRTIFAAVAAARFAFVPC